MKSNLLLDKIHLIQTEYKELLATLLPKLKSSHSPEALDEINLFWLRHIEEIQLYLKAWFPGENSYVFTAATFMDFEDNEHLPFLLMGDKHILDDPLSKYSEIRSKMPDGKDAEFLYEQIGVTAEDNLKLLENVHGEILILPLRLLNQSNGYHSLYSVGGQAFISLFNGIDNLNDYFAKCNSIDDIIRFAREDIGRLVMFSEDDNVMLPFGERFRGALSGTKYMVDRAKPDVLMEKLIYLDNAATTLRKPPGVAEAVAQAILTAGNATRGAHGASMQASRTVYETRQKLARLLGCPRPDHVVFTSNSTTALNICDRDSAEVSDVLYADYGIATRPGAHCAPRLHEALGTVRQGAVRFSFSVFNSEDEVDMAIQAVKELAQSK